MNIFSSCFSLFLSKVHSSLIWLFVIAVPQSDSLPSLSIWEVLILPLISRFLKSDLFCVTKHSTEWTQHFTKLLAPDVAGIEHCPHSHLSRLHQANAELLHLTQPIGDIYPEDCPSWLGCPFVWCQNSLSI